MVAYLGTAAAATRARSAKTSDDLRAVFGDGRTRGTFVPFEDAEAAGAIVGAHEPIAFDGGSLRDAVILAEAARAAYRRRGDEDDAAVEEYSKCDDAMFYFGGSERPTTGMTLVTHARRCLLYTLTLPTILLV